MFCIYYVWSENAWIWVGKRYWPYAFAYTFGQTVTLKITLKLPNVILEDAVCSLGGVHVFLRVDTDILEGPAASIFMVWSV